jgi:hypothetical protein
VWDVREPPARVLDPAAVKEPGEAGAREPVKLHATV